MIHSFNFIEESLAQIKTALKRMQSLINDYYIPKIEDLEKRNQELIKQLKQLESS